MMARFLKEGMHPLIGSKKMENGIVVFWKEGNDRKWDSLQYNELIDMQINALDLLENPKTYALDPATRKVVMLK
ncbi:MAG: hypothetical protein LUQ40_00050 [Methanomicrobiales archaeon]|nr:hypothetical protein [Methanomicrobiales archaeon]